MLMAGLDKVDTKFLMDSSFTCHTPAPMDETIQDLLCDERSANSIDSTTSNFLRTASYRSFWNAVYLQGTILRCQLNSHFDPCHFLLLQKPLPHWKVGNMMLSKTPHRHLFSVTNYLYILHNQMIGNFRSLRCGKLSGGTHSFRRRFWN
eukprot:scpid104965/ scgid31992/ 